MKQRLLHRLLPIFMSLAVILSVFSVQPTAVFAKSNGKLTAEQLANIDTIVDYLMGKGFNSAAICGILANLDYEAGFIPTCSSSTGAAYGICQWTSSRQSQLKSMYPDTYQTLDSQLEFMYFELSTKGYHDKSNLYSTNQAELIDILLAVPDTSSGASTAGAAWCKLFERPASDTSAKRGQYAVDIYWPLYGMTTQAPQISSVGNTSAGIQLKWSSIEGAENYIVFRSASGSDDLAEYDRTDSTTYTDEATEAGVSYSYSVQACNEEAVSQKSSPPVTCVRLLTPVLDSAVNSESGVTLSWEASEGAASYVIYRKADSAATWKYITKIAADAAAASDTETLSWCDTSVSGGSVYAYTIRAVNGSSLSSYDPAGVSTTYIPMPVVQAANVDSGIYLRWSACGGATCYRIYLQTDSGWTPLSDQRASATSWIWTEAEEAESYTFTVCALSSAASSVYDPDGVTITRLTTPQLKTVGNLSSGIRITWAPVTGAESYAVYRKIGTASWKSLTSVNDGTEWTDTTAPAGTVCRYTVRALSGTFISSYNTSGLAVCRLTEPVLLQPSNIAAGLCIRWNAVQGATGYRIYRKGSGDTGWTFMKTVAAPTVTWTDSDASSGKTYKYTVKAIAGSSASSFSSAGADGIRLSNPVLQSVANTSSGITVRWGAVTGTETYYIFRRTSGTSWKRIGQTATGTTSLTDTRVSDGTTYLYTVRSGSSAAGTLMLSGFNSSGISCYRLSSVKISSLTTQAGTGKMTLKWKTNSKACGYIIRYSSDKSFKTYSSVRVTSNTTSSKTISGLTKGKTYYVQIAAYKKPGTATYYSAWSQSSVLVQK